MTLKTILIIGREDILSYSVELYLTNQKGWNVVSFSNKENLDELIRAVNKVNPDVVIIHQEDQAHPLNLPTILLQDHPSLKVITLSLNNNLMEVYSKQNILVQSTTDLISVIEANPVIHTINNNGGEEFNPKGDDPN